MSSTQKRQLYCECELCSEYHVQPDCVVCGGRGLAPLGLTESQLERILLKGKEIKKEHKDLLADHKLTVEDSNDSAKKWEELTKALGAHGENSDPLLGSDSNEDIHHRAMERVRDLIANQAN